jgi:hypothetical protein
MEVVQNLVALGKMDASAERHHGDTSEKLLADAIHTEFINDDAL